MFLRDESCVLLKSCGEFIVHEEESALPAPAQIRPGAQATEKIERRGKKRGRGKRALRRSDARLTTQFAVRVVVAVFPPWFTPMVVVPVVLVVANPAFTGALAIVATFEMVELQCELMLTSWVVLSLKVPRAMNCCVP